MLNTVAAILKDGFKLASLVFFVMYAINTRQEKKMEYLMLAIYTAVIAATFFS